MSTFTSNTSNEYKLRLIVVEQTYSTANNSSNVLWELWLDAGTYYFQANGNNINCNVDGQVYSNSNAYLGFSGPNTSLKIASGSKTIYHNSEGKKTINVSASFKATKSGYYMPTAEMKLSGEFKLTDIPRMATLTNCSNFNDEDNPKIVYSNPAGLSVSSLQACISLTGLHDDVPYRDISKSGTSYVFELTDEERKTLRTATTGSTKRTVNFCIRTIIGGTSYYSHQSVTFEVINCSPTIDSFTHQDTNVKAISLTGSNQRYIKYVSNPKLDFTYTLKKNATLDRTETSVGTFNYEGTTHTYKDIECVSDVFKFHVKDKRNQTRTISKNIELVPYVNLVINEFELHRTEQTSNKAILNLSGIWYNGNFNLEENTNPNTLNISLKYKDITDNETEWQTYEGDLQLTLNENKFYIKNLELDGTFTYLHQFQFQILISDLIQSVTNVAGSGALLKGIPIIDIGDDDINVNGKLTLNNHKVLTANQVREIKTESDEDTYSCNYINSVAGSGGTSNYNALDNKPSINNVTLSGNITASELGLQPAGNYINDPFYVHTDNNFTNDEKTKLSGIETGAEKNKVTSVNNQTGDVVIDVPTKLSDLTDDAGFITGYTETDPTVPTHVKSITEQDITNWNNKSSFSGSYNDLSDKPNIPTKTSNLINDSDFVSDSNYTHTDNNFTNDEKTKLSGIETGAEKNKVTSVNNQTGDVVIDVPTKLSDLTDDLGDNPTHTHNYNNLTNQPMTNLVGTESDAINLFKFTSTGIYRLIGTSIFPFKMDPSTGAPNYNLVSFDGGIMIINRIDSLDSDNTSIKGMFINGAGNSLSSSSTTEIYVFSIKYSTDDLVIDQTYGNIIYLNNIVTEREFDMLLYKLQELFTSIDENKQNVLTSVTGYDATKTQVLKNVNGTLQWIDE